MKFAANGPLPHGCFLWFEVEDGKVQKPYVQLRVGMSLARAWQARSAASMRIRDLRKQGDIEDVEGWIPTGQVGVGPPAYAEGSVVCEYRAKGERDPRKTKEKP